eukprot:6455336-Amphidinium_carterae.1
MMQAIRDEIKRDNEELHSKFMELMGRVDCMSASTTLSASVASSSTPRFVINLSTSVAHMVRACHVEHA